MNTVCISTKNVYPPKSRRGQNTGRPLHFKKWGNVPIHARIQAHATYNGLRENYRCGELNLRRSPMSREHNTILKWIHTRNGKLQTSIHTTEYHCFHKKWHSNYERSPSFQTTYTDSLMNDSTQEMNSGPRIFVTSGIGSFGLYTGCFTNGSGISTWTSGFGRLVWCTRTFEK